jgi:LDH2 family malate/lactate/ureidoglycolate dehydrogenase
MDSTRAAIDFEALRAYIREIFQRLKAPPEQAAVVADNLAEADLRGVASHGANLVALYVGRIRSGTLSPRTEVRILQDQGASAVLDGGMGFGQVAGVQGMDLAVRKARQYGTGVVVVRETTHLGALAYYTLRAAAQGCFGLAMQNGPPMIPPFGGVTGTFSTNPFSYAAPGREEPPIVLDMATTTVAGNKLILARKRGDKSIPEGWAVDEQGRPTTDPFAAARGHQQWAGGYKGYGIALLVEVLAAVLPGTSFAHTEISPSEPKGKDRIVRGHFFLAIDPDHFLPPGVFRERIDALIRDVQSSEPAASVERVYVSGRPEHERRAQRLREGIPLDLAVINELDQIGRELGMPPLARKEG